MKLHTKSLIRLIREVVGEPSTGCEVGVWTGWNSLHLLRTFDRLTLLMVDRWMQYADMAALSQEKMDAVMLEAVAVTRDHEDRRVVVVSDSVRAAAIVKSSSLDFCFIDGFHSYEAMKEDLPAWWEKVRPGGLFCGHDYDGRGDRRGRFGVKRAVDEFAKEHGCEIKVAPQHVWWTIR